MDGHRGIPEPYIILKECDCEAIYDSPEEGDGANGDSPRTSPLPTDARPPKTPGSN